ncbi:cobalt transporter CbiM [Desulfogranum japonicum]|uniref:cobalt transporter CbiM n=1 Tax=Desulfogranum japonicum TaxID=231447 RepID=UPI00041935DC|nr:cobalt transporter CbiM [Desulfogranum japonicum]
MHITEGVLSLPILAGSGVIACIGTAIGLQQLNQEKIITAGLFSAAFFVASLIHVPIGPGNIHLILNGMVGLLLGWAAFPVILTALVLQAVLFGFGGITALGANTVIMAGPALLVYYLFRNAIEQTGKKQMICAFLAGAGSIFGSALLASVFLFASGQSYIHSATTLFWLHVPLMLVEGCVTLFAVSFLEKVQPDMLHSPCS